MKRLCALMRKTVFLGVCAVLAACGFGGHFFLEQSDVENQIVKVEKPRRAIPANADLGAYLAAVVARDNQDISLASKYYARSYVQDKDNTQLKNDLYIMSGLSGQIDDFMLVLEDMSSADDMYYATSFKAAKLFKEADYQQVIDLLPSRQPSEGLERILYPLMRAWSYAGLRDAPRAYKELEVFKSPDQMPSVYWGHKAMISAYLGQVDDAEQAFEQMGKEQIPSETMLLAMRWFYRKQNVWQSTHPMHQKYIKTVIQRPAVREILIHRADEFDLTTPSVGVADAFFLVSRAAYDIAQSVETGLVFNMMAVYLNPNLSLYKIWSAEQFEEALHYAEANRMYESIRQPTETIVFKQALNLIAMNKIDRAERILSDLSVRLPNDKTVKRVLADLYIKTNRAKQAVSLYTQLLQQDSATGNVKSKADLFFARAVAYGKAGDKTAQIQDLQMAVNLRPNDAYLLNYLGYLWLDNHQEYDLAMKYIRQAHQLAPQEPYIWDSLAWGYYLGGQYEQALFYGEKSADKMPYSALVQSHLGDIYSAFGRLREAGYQYKKALALKEDMSDELRTQLTQKISKLID